MSRTPAELWPRVQFISPPMNEPRPPMNAPRPPMNEPPGPPINLPSTQELREQIRQHWANTQKSFTERLVEVMNNPPRKDIDKCAGCNAPVFWATPSDGDPIAFDATTTEVWVMGELGRAKHKTIGHRPHRATCGRKAMFGR